MFMPYSTMLYYNKLFALPINLNGMVGYGERNDSTRRLLSRHSSTSDESLLIGFA